jgi:predicted nucleotidyltransferase
MAMKHLVNLERLPGEVRGRVASYGEEMIQLHGEKIDSIVVYGSATGINFVPKRSDVNLLIVVGDLDHDLLRRSLKLVDGGIKKRIAAPLFLTKENIERSLDVFPIEYQEMQDNHVVIYGEDPLAGIEIDPERLRLECEEQLRGKLVRLRQAYLEIGLRRKGIERLLKESLSALIPAFRGVLRLVGQEPSVRKDEVIKALASTFNMDGQVLLEVLHDQQADEKIGKEEAETFFGRYLEILTELTAAVDHLFEEGA